MLNLRRGRRRRFTSRRRKNKRTVYNRRIRQNGFIRRAGFYRESNGFTLQHKQELKFLDSAIFADPILTTGTIFESLNNVSQGTGENQRIGRNIMIKKIMIQGQIHLSLQTLLQNSHDVVRIIVYLDKQANGTPAVVSDILETANMNSFRNLANSKRFTFLTDKKTTLNSMSSVTGNEIPPVPQTFATMAVIKQWQVFINANIPIEFDSTTGATSEIRSNNIGVLVISRDPSRTRFNFTVRIRFTG